MIVLFVCPPGKARAMMTGADRILTGYLYREGAFSYEGRKRIIFCESDAFGELTADLQDRERWLRLPAARRPAPPKPTPASRQMWQLPELPPPASAARHPHTWVHGAPCAPLRDTDELTITPWRHPAMIEALPQRP